MTTLLTRRQAPTPVTRAVARTRKPRSSQIIAAVTILAIFSLLALFASVFAPHDPTAGDFPKYLPAGSPGHLLGTDELGRDLLSRLFYGGRTSLVLPVAGVAIATVIGTVFALIAGFGSDAIQGLIMRFVDVMFAFPVIMVALALALILDPGTPVVLISIVVVATPYVARVVFTEVKNQRNREYIEAATSSGAGFWSVLFREVLPNVVGQIVVYSTSLIGSMIVFIASLSALGIGVQPPEPDWGRMIAEGAKVIISGNVIPALVPGLAVMLVALAFNWLGDGLRDVFDPRRLKGTR